MRPRNVVLMLDGTWSAAETHTNVERLRQLIAPHDADGVAQSVAYLPGVGVRPGLGHWLGGMFGLGLADLVREGYQWLCNHWQSGDAVYLFGFSRGAYAARSLAGMIDQCGLLHADGHGQVDATAVATAYAIYRNAGSPGGIAAAQAFRARSSTIVDIHFIGVWETVGDLGIPNTAAWFPFSRARYRFHDTQLSGCVRHACQALALDEHRADFAPTLWTAGPAATEPGAAVPSMAAEVEQRWFIGSHSDVGGGYAHDGAGRAPDPLPDLPLAWLQRRAMAAGLACTATVIPMPNADLGVPRNSYAEFLHGLYRLFSRPYVRPIGTGVNESVDDSVWQRWQADATYRSPSLMQAIKQAVITVPGNVLRR